jgi:hypothetical protein
MTEIKLISCATSGAGEHPLSMEMYDSKMHPFAIVDTLDPGSIRFDDRRSPPGWASRNGFPMRIVSRVEACSCAIVGTIRDFLERPLSLWGQIVPTISRNAFIELSRAYPPFPHSTKIDLCYLLGDIVREVLRGDKVPQGTDFHFVVRASRKQVMWGKDHCENCDHWRCGATRLALMFPCAHALCLDPRCVSDASVRECPLCSKTATTIGVSCVSAGSAGSSPLKEVHCCGITRSKTEQSLGALMEAGARVIEVDVVEIPPRVIAKCIKKIMRVQGKCFRG